MLYDILDHCKSYMMKNDNNNKKRRAIVLATAIALIGSGLIFATVPMNRRWPDYLAHRLREMLVVRHASCRLSTRVFQRQSTHTSSEIPQAGGSWSRDDAAFPVRRIWD
jgi:hypothetical protein